MGAIIGEWGGAIVPLAVQCNKNATGRAVGSGPQAGYTNAMTYPTAHLPIPELAIDESGHVSSASFGDVYFSRADGEAETRHVFLAGNGLPQRWQGRAHFTIGELGFGTGLNFLVAWREFLRNGNGHLHYISVEKFPLTRTQLASLHPELAAIYPLRLPGWHRIQLERCTLTLGFGDAEHLLGGMPSAQVDAWFLDGFAPAKNPDMWSDALFVNLARLSAPDATCATFTAAGFVRRGLMAQGFTMQKVPGFAHKREMLMGVRAGEAVQTVRPTHVTVVGAGIAGTTVARALAARGVTVRVLEKHRVASGASGNPAAVLYPQLTKQYGPATQWHLLGYALMLRQLARWQREGLDFTWEMPGMLRLPRDGGAAALLASLGLDSDVAAPITAYDAASRAGMEVAGDGMWLPAGCWIDPAELCRALLAHPHITLQEGTALTKPAPDEVTVLCNAHAATALLPHLPMGQSAGQVSRIACAVPPRCITSHRGYVVPLKQEVLVGATYDRDDMSGAVTDANHDENLAHAHAALPALELGDVLDGRSAIRATTPDRLPYVGAVNPHLYVSVGHGSRGMVSAPLAAEVIASQMCGEPVPLTAELAEAIAPLRRAHPSS